MSEENGQAESGQQEPSMEDILASIRRILSEDEEEGGEAPAPAPEPDPEPEPVAAMPEPEPEPVFEPEPEPEPVTEPEPPVQMEKLFETEKVESEIWKVSISSRRTTPVDSLWKNTTR